ncbi:MAG: hypothetical protein V7641_651 [Blastocatellia bacterium]
MKMKMDDVLVYKDSQLATRYGTGVVISVTPAEYTILWSGRGLTKYKRSILDGKLEQTFQPVDDRAGFPKERHLQLGTAKVRVAFNENYDRAKLAVLCEKLKLSAAGKAKDVAAGLAAELFTKKLVLRGQAKAVLCQLAELCDTKAPAACDEAQNISRELFFGYVLKKTDFQELIRE